MLKAFKSLLNQELSFLKNARILIANSGGMDSVVLTHLCCNENLNISLAHCNFKLRGDESDLDEDFVLELGDRLDLEVFTQSFDTQSYMKLHKKSLQMAARELRYDWFQNLAEQLNFDYILTAHHADDNLETFLINFSRGTGINGLTGIPMLNDNIVRPLLGFSREQIRSLAEEQHWDWREDASNSSRKYLRNKLRHEVIPILKSINPNLIGSFQTTLDNLKDTADIVEESLNAVAKRAITHIDENEVHFKISEFKKVNNPKAYLHEMFKSYGFTEWDDVLGLLDAQSGKYLMSETHRLIKHRASLILTDIEELTHDPVLIESEDADVNFAIGNISLAKISEIGENSRNAIYLDRDALQFPLELRLWESGDFFMPSGMTGKKKLSKYLKDEKTSLTEKERTWVLCSGGDILWVIGKRADRRKLANETTSHVLHIQFKPAKAFIL